jgi:hypothetical protein
MSGLFTNADTHPRIPEDISIVSMIKEIMEKVGRASYICIDL